MSDAPRSRPRTSYSKLDRHATCPLSYRLHYIDRHPSESGTPALLGQALHAANEETVLEHVREELCAPLSEERAIEHWKRAFTDAGLAGQALFNEGLELVCAFVRDQGVLDAHDVLAVEEPFTIEVGDFDVVGVLDRVDRVDDRTIKIIDYKSSRLLFTREEVDTSLQMSIYHLAARELWPWAERVFVSFWMLRHGIQQEAERTPEQLESARHYVEALARAANEATEFPARPNPNCVWCDHRRHCPAYAEALAGKRDIICEDITDLESVAREREEVARIAKVAYARRDELDKVLRAHLDANDELVLAGTRYSLFKVEQRRYPLAETAAVIQRETGLAPEEIVPRIAAVENKALEKLLREHAAELGRSRSRLLKVELDAMATTTHSSRLWGKPVRPRGAVASEGKDAPARS